MCKTRVPGIFWGDELGVQMIEIQENQEINNTSLRVQLIGLVMKLLIQVSECAKLVLAIVGMLSLLRHFVCPQRGKTTRSIATQSQCTYTSLRNVQEPRFQLLDANRQGAFL